MFKDHHYLDGNINKASRCYVGVWEGNVVAFGATITMPSGTLKNAWRGHRTVILPDYQGMGLGVRFSDAVAQIHLDEGHRYFSRTAHLRKDVSLANMYKEHYFDNKRICFSHEYIGKEE